MMPSQSIDNRSNARLSCWLLAGSAHTRVGLLELCTNAPPISSRNMRDARSSQHAHPRFKAKTARRPLRRNLLKPSPAAKSP